MKAFFTKCKEGVSKIFENIFKYDVCIYICSGLTIFYLLFSFKSEINHTKEIFKRDVELIERDMEFRYLDDIITQQDNVNSFQREELDKAGNIIRNQQRVIDKLIEELKKAGKWPPKIEPINPDNAT